MRLLSIEIQTETKELVALPNIYVITNPLERNHEDGVIISAVVSLGYNTPWKKVEKKLAEAGSRTSDPGPCMWA